MTALWRPEQTAETPASTGTGTVAVCAGEASRYSAFAASLSALELPPGWAVRFYLGSDLVQGRNRAVAELEGEHVLFMDDDHLLPPDLVPRLLAHDRDIVGVLHADRDYPCVEPTPEGPPGLYEVEVVGAPGCSSTAASSSRSTRPSPTGRRLRTRTTTSALEPGRPASRSGRTRA
jgi:Glycosyl transferase family 2